MEGFKIKIKQLVISQPLAERLVALGLHRAAAFHWCNDIDFDIDTEKEAVKKWELGSENVEDYPEEDCLPAWTLEELRIMIGWHYNGSDLRDHRPEPMPREEFQFVNYYSTSMKSYESGAEANGEWLEYLINKGDLKVEEINQRYKEKFKPE